MLIPLAGWGFLWYHHEKIVAWEWAASVAAGVAISATVFAVADMVGSHDRETWSGHATQALHTPWWRAEWTETETYTVADSKGNSSLQTRLVTKSETHQPRWWLNTTIGEIDVDESVFTDIRGRYGGYSELGHRPDFDDGDRLDYFSNPIPMEDYHRPVYPVHRHIRWANPLLGTDSIILGREISEEEARSRNLFEYPESGNALSSARVLGFANVSSYRWDQMCAALGEPKKVNVILIAFGGRPMDDAVLQRDYWRNGRKNDLVLCYGDGWAYVFGWSKSELVKQELQELLAQPVSDVSVPLIQNVIWEHFQPYVWTQHDDTPRPVSGWAVLIAFLTMGGAQYGLFRLFHDNGVDKKYRKNVYV